MAKAMTMAHPSTPDFPNILSDNEFQDEGRKWSTYPASIRMTAGAAECSSSTPAPADNAKEPVYTYGDFKYTKQGDCCTIVEYVGKGGTVTIHHLQFMLFHHQALILIQQLRQRWVH